MQLFFVTLLATIGVASALLDAPVNLCVEGISWEHQVSGCAQRAVSLGRRLTRSPPCASGRGDLGG